MTGESTSEINIPEYVVDYVQGDDRTLVIFYGKRVDGVKDDDTVV